MTKDIIHRRFADTPLGQIHYATSGHGFILISYPCINFRFAISFGAVSNLGFPERIA
jgi:hypothetical protein